MAESVDALVSNTSGAIRAGSTPAQGTRKAIQSLVNHVVESLYFVFTGKLPAKMEFSAENMLQNILMK